MKRIIVLILMIGCLLCCEKPVDMYVGTLSGVEYSPKSSWGGMSSWTLTFEDGQIYTVHVQPLEGFKVGSSYAIYMNWDGHLRARRAK